MDLALGTPARCILPSVPAHLHRSSFHRTACLKLDETRADDTWLVATASGCEPQFPRSPEGMLTVFLYNMETYPDIFITKTVSKDI